MSEPSLEKKLHQEILQSLKNGKTCHCLPDTHFIAHRYFLSKRFAVTTRIHFHGERIHGIAYLEDVATLKKLGIEA